MNYLEHLIPIILDARESSDEPLDGDDVEYLIDCLKDIINLHEGNIVEHEVQHEETLDKYHIEYIELEKE